MALQPQDEWDEPYAANGCPNVETSQYSQNIIQTPKIIFTFSPITNIATELPSNNEDSNDIEKYLSITLDMESKVNQMIDDDKFQLEDLSCSESDGWLTKELEVMALEAIDDSIKDRVMTVEIQPPVNIRRRYQSDGKRQIEKSRSKPMTIKLPDLNDCQLNPNQSFWIQLILITCNTNPANTVYIHVDKLEYHEDDLPECDHGFVRILLTPTDIQKGNKQLPRISIIKTKLDTYKFELTPFNRLSTNNPTEIYENKNTKSVVAKAKCFRHTYNLKSSRIACQLLIKQNETWHTTNIICETNIMEEKEKQNNSKQSSKLSTPSNDSDDNEYQPQIDHRSFTKKRKGSPSLKKSLPVTRVKKS